MGCAKPMLTRVDGPPGMPVILGGGRKRLMNTSDILLWSNPDGTGRAESWEEHSISFWHNKLAPPPMARFTHQINSTKEPRQNSSYVSLINAGVGELVVVYELRATPEEATETPSTSDKSGGEKDTVFAMRVSVVV